MLIVVLFLIILAVSTLGYPLNGYYVQDLPIASYAGQVQIQRSDPNISAKVFFWYEIQLIIGIFLPQRKLFLNLLFFGFKVVLVQAQ